jgi:hypothetical protein
MELGCIMYAYASLHQYVLSKNAWHYMRPDKAKGSQAYERSKGCWKTLIKFGQSTLIP